MMKVYLDLGKKSDKTDGIITVAAATFKRVPYKQFVRVWNPMVKGWGSKAFHATDFYTGAREFWWKLSDGTLDTDRRGRHEHDSKRIPYVISQHVTRLTAIAFRPHEFDEVASDAFKAEVGTCLHSIAIQLFLILNGWWALDLGYRDGFACFMESGDADTAEVVDTVERMKAHGTTGPHIQVKSFTTIDKGEARGLEAADCLAWHWNKYYMDKMRFGKDTEPRKDFAAMMTVAEDKTFVSLITGDKLKWILSRAPLPNGVSALASGESWDASRFAADHL